MKSTNFDIVGARKIWYVVSAVLIIPGILSLFIWGLNVGIDFKGGTSQQIDFGTTRPDIQAIRSTVQTTKVTDVTVQTSNNTLIIVTFPNEAGQTPRDEGTAILKALQSKYGSTVTEKAFQNIGGSVAQDTTIKAVEAVVISCIAIILFIAFSFRSVPRPASSWRFAATTIAALAHDLLFVIGAFSLIGHFFPQIEVDALFITALLTILGFSVNDTIVVFDRIRENLRRTPTKTFSEITNISLNQTLARSINTSMTVLIVLLSLVFLGGDSIRNFILALTLGVAIGTYSSIFNASPLLVSWQLWADARETKKK